jgi:hypothetical protein
MKNFYKTLAVLFIVAIIALALLLPIGAGLVLAKLCGLGITWTGACIPFFIALAFLSVALISKLIIDLARVGGENG